VLIAIGYVVGIGFELPEIQAWAGNEVVQVIANAAIIITLIVAIGLIDAAVYEVVSAPPGINIGCAPGNSCLQLATKAYLDDYISAAKTGARNVLLNNVDAAGRANRRWGATCITIFCLQFGASFTTAGEYLLNQDIYGILFEYYTNVLSSLEAQAFFVSQIAFKMGPIILAIGLVARSFFMTRKLGGLLVAISAGIMFFLPAMYIFDWATLDVTLNGDKALGQDNFACPQECKLTPPLALVNGGSGYLYNLTSVYDAYSDPQIAQQIVAGTMQASQSDAGTTSGSQITSCNYGAGQTCPSECRELPYPLTPTCVNQTVQTACASLQKECKIIRYVTQPPSPQENLCPATCKVIPPLKSDCSVGSNNQPTNCLQSRFDCRVAQTNNLSWRPTSPNTRGGNGNAQACQLASQCPASLTATASCVYILPQTGNCNTLCAACPAQCRIEGANINQLPPECKNGNQLIAQCNSNVCIPGCKVNIANINALTPPPGNCTTCRAERRIVSPTLPANPYLTDTQTDGCSLNNCPADYRLPIPQSACDACVFTDESYTYAPAINTQCSQLCTPPNNGPLKTAGTYSQIGADGLVGRPEIVNLSKLLVPAYVLPLFNIVATLVFIKGLSGILGGDIEIPGLNKVF
ncbi:hypothetical protein HZC07_02720, partial [Candidatus Micrarchaeota archaeon]|nr:hypothetical protein [Candidatus Micrarchaeota archaeon]